MMRFKNVSPGTELHGRSALERPMRLERPAARMAPGTNTTEILTGLGARCSGLGARGSGLGARGSGLGGSGIWARLCQIVTISCRNWAHLRHSGAGAAPPAGRQGTRKMERFRRPPWSAEPLWGEPLRPPVSLTSPYEVPTLTPFSSSACGRALAAPREGRADRTVVGAPGIVRAASSRPFTHRSACRAPGMIRGSAHRRTRVCQRERSRDF